MVDRQSIRKTILKANWSMYIVYCPFVCLEGVGDQTPPASVPSLEESSVRVPPAPGLLLLPGGNYSDSGTFIMMLNLFIVPLPAQDSGNQLSCPTPISSTKRPLGFNVERDSATGLRWESMPNGPPSSAILGP